MDIDKETLHAMKVIKILGTSIYAILIVLSMFIFIFYAYLVLEANRYYAASDLNRLESEEIKTIIGFSELTNITINGYRYQYMAGDDVIDHFIFDIVLPNNEYQRFVDLTNTQMGDIYKLFNREQPLVEIIEDNFLSDNLRLIQIDYMGYEGSEWEIRDYIKQNKHNVQYSSKVWMLIPQFLLLLLAYAISYFTLKILYKMILKKKL